MNIKGKKTDRFSFNKGEQHMNTPDLIIKNCNTNISSYPLDIAINKGYIYDIAQNINAKAKDEINAKGKFVCSAFVDSHTHPDKAYIPCDHFATDLLTAIKTSDKYARSLNFDDIAQDVYTRGCKMVENEIRSGTCAIKAQLISDDIWQMESLKGIMQIRDKYKKYIDIYTVVPWTKNQAQLFHNAALNGEIDFIGGYPTLSKNYVETVDTLFEMAQKYNLPLDLHVDESDSPNIDCFEYILRKTIETDMLGRVSCGHVTALSAVDDVRAIKAMELCSEAQVNIITLPSCNMYLMGRNDKQPIRRGVTRVDELMKHGVNVAYASDNIRDPFRPFGNGNMLEEGLFTAQVLQYGTPHLLNKIMEMGTVNGAKNMLLDNYGIAAGCKADLVIFNNKAFSDAVLSNTACQYAIKNGQITVINGIIQDL